MHNRSFAYSMISMSYDGSCSSRLFLDALMLNKLVFLETDSNNECPCEELEDYAINLIIETEPLAIMEIVAQQDYRVMDVGSRDIPQFSDVQDACRTVEIMAASEQYDVTFPELGMYLDPTGSRSPAAQQKYGENHFKLAQQLGLLSISKCGYKFANILGRGFIKIESQKEKDAVIGKLAMRIPFIQYVILKSKDTNGVRVIDELNERLANSTALRRRSNIETLSRYIRGLNDSELNDLLNRVDWESLR